MDYEALVVADDLTGAADTGTRFAERGYDTVVATGDGAPASDVLVVDTDSRYLDPEAAAGRVRAAVEGHDAGLVYKKVDSTLRGNLAAEVDAALDAAGADLAVVAPAFPATGRTTVGGVHLVDGTPVAATGAGDDPDAPVTSSHLPTLLGGSRHPVAQLSIERVAEGVGAVADALAEIRGERGTALVACDAARGEHLAAVADGAARHDALYVGSAGLAGHVRLGDERAVLGVVGSTAPETLAALEALPDAQVIALDGKRAIDDVEAAVDGTAAAAADALAAEGRAVITAARSGADLEATLAAGRDAGLEDGETRDRIAAALGHAARETAERAPVSGLFLTGGATATAALDALDARGLALTGRSVAAGVPVTRIDGGALDGVPAVTKAGAFGGSETILTCLDALAAHDG